MTSSSSSSGATPRPPLPSDELQRIVRATLARRPHSGKTVVGLRTDWTKAARTAWELETRAKDAFVAAEQVPASDPTRRAAAKRTAEEAEAAAATVREFERDLYRAVTPVVNRRLAQIEKAIAYRTQTPELMAESRAKVLERLDWPHLFSMQQPPPPFEEFFRKLARTSTQFTYDHGLNPDFLRNPQLRSLYGDIVSAYRDLEQAERQPLLSTLPSRLAAAMSSESDQERLATYLTTKAGVTDRPGVVARALWGREIDEANAKEKKRLNTDASLAWADAARHGRVAARLAGIPAQIAAISNDGKGHEDERIWALGYSVSLDYSAERRDQALARFHEGVTALRSFVRAHQDELLPTLPPPDKEDTHRALGALETEKALLHRM